MKRTHLGVSLTCLTMTLGASAFAADLAPAGPSAPGFQPTPGVITMMTLGSGGLLMPLLSDDVFASQQARIGDSRTTDGYAKSLPAGVPQPKYRDLNTTAVGTLGVMKEIPASTGAAFLRLAGSGAWTSGSINTPLDTSVPNDRFIAQAFYAPNPSQMFGVGVVYDHIAAKTKETSDPFGSYLMQVRSSFGYQLFYAQQFSPFWGIAAKSEIWRGSTTVNIHQFIGPGVPLLISQQQGDDRVYGELNLVGTFSKQNAPWMIDGIVAHPSVGATFERSFEQTVRNSMGATVTGNAGPVENYGLIMANLRLERAQSPSPQLQLLPSITLGFEHEYVNDLAQYVKEPNFAVLGAGVGMTAFGQRIDLEYKMRQGLTGARQYQSFVLSTSLNF